MQSIKPKAISRQQSAISVVLMLFCLLSSARAGWYDWPVASTNVNAGGYTNNAGGFAYLHSDDRQGHPNYDINAGPIETGLNLAEALRQLQKMCMDFTDGKALDAIGNLKPEVVTSNNIALNAVTYDKLSVQVQSVLSKIEGTNQLVVVMVTNAATYAFHYESAAAISPFAANNTWYSLGDITILSNSYRKVRVEYAVDFQSGTDAWKVFGVGFATNATPITKPRATVRMSGGTYGSDYVTTRFTDTIWLEYATNGLTISVQAKIYSGLTGTTGARLTRWEVWGVP